MIIDNKKDKGFKRNQIKTKSNVNFRAILFGLSGLGLVLLIVYLINLFFTTSNLKLEKVTVLGNKTISENEVNWIVKPFSGKNMALVNTSEIVDSLKKNFPIIQGVQITKQYPNRLFIKINEREPKIVFITLNGAYVVDTEGKILNVLSSLKVDFSPDKILITRGLGDYNSQILKDYFLNEFILQNKLSEKTEEERQKIIALTYNFDTITQAQKTTVLKNLAVEYKKEIDELFAKNNGIVLGSKYKDLPEIYGLQNVELQLDDSIDMTKQTLTLELINRMNLSQMNFNEIIWEGEILVRVVLKDGKQLIFSNRRTLSDQWEDYQLVINDLSKRGKNFSIIDLSSTKISVIN